MVEDKYLTAEQANDVVAAQFEIKSQQAPIHAPHFVMYVKDVLSQKIWTQGCLTRRT